MARRTPTHPTKGVAEGLDRVAEAVREVVRAVGPDLRTVTKWGAPWYVGTDLIFLVREFSPYVGVEFWRGTSLPDPHRLLEGTGKNLRHVKIRSTAEATSPEFVALVREAIRIDGVEPKRTR
jgi:hypothetical protein